LKAKHPIDVAAGIVEKDGLIFLARRMAGGPAGGKWEFPGGKIGLHEDAETALKRELLEELEMSVNVRSHLGVFETEVMKTLIRLHVFICESDALDLKLHNHTEYGWFQPSEALELEMPSPDIPALRAYILSRV